MNKPNNRTRPRARTRLLFCLLLVASCAVAAAAHKAAAARGPAPAATPEPTPSPPGKIVFDPPDVNVLPGRPVTVTATAFDAENREVKCGEFKYELADESHKDFIMLLPEDEDCGTAGQKATGKRLVLVGVFTDDKPARPASAPIIVTFSKDDKQIRGVLNVGLTDGGRPPGPIPPGLRPQVDVMWDVLPGNVVHANFGRKVRGDYYGIQITIGNNSGYDLQLASAGFTLKRPIATPSGAKYPLPTASYQLARGSIAREQEVGLRARFVNSLDAFGPVLTGFVPFFHVVNRRSNFSQLVNVFSNPFNAGAKLVFPDTVIGQLGRLEQQTFRNDQTARTIIPNNTQIAIVTFFPKQSLRNYMLQALGYQKKDLDDPLKVMEALGDLVLVGQQVEYLNRVRLIGDTEQRVTANVSGRVTDACGKGMPDVEVTITGGPFFKAPPVKTGPDGTYTFQNIPTGEDYKVTPVKEGVTFVSAGGDSFKLEDNRSNVNFQAKEDTGAISGTVQDESGKPIPNVTVRTNTNKTATTKEDGVYTISGLAPGNYTLKVDKIQGFKFAETENPRTVTLKCNTKTEDFKGTTDKDDK